MKEVKLTRQRLRTCSAYASTMTNEELLECVRRGAIDDDDDRWSWEQGWIVDSVEVVSRFPDPSNKPTHVTPLDRVVALITEHKNTQVPDTTEEYAAR